MKSSSNPPENPSRRNVLAAAGLGAALGWIPIFEVPAASAASTLATPPNFPSGISLYQQAYQNWSEGISIDAVWTCAPVTPAHLVTLANWANANGYRLRAKGMSHNWSPILVPNGADVSKILLVDTTKNLTAVSINTTSTPRLVTAQAGLTMDSLLATLEAAGLGFAAIPAPGDITLGGMLAINAHGSAIPASGETRPTGMTYGSLSNLIHSLTAVVWDTSSSTYVLKTFTRTDSAIQAFMAHLGRAFIIDVTLQVGTNQTLSCYSRFDIQVTDLFAAPASAGANSFASLVNTYGRVEAIWFPFTTIPWVKLWAVAPSQPAFSVKVTSPYNYTFANSLSQSSSDSTKAWLLANPTLTPSWSNTEMSIVGSGLITTATFYIWGASKNVLLYVKPTTLRIVEMGFAVLTSRANIQQVVYDLYTKYQALLTTYQNNGYYPMNGPIELRVTGLDKAGEVDGVSGALTPQLSSVRPRPDHPEWDTCVWLDLATLPGTPQSDAFYAEMEAWIWSHYSGSYATVRPEWSKAWAVTGAGGPWTNTTALTSTIKNALNAGQATNDNFDTARATLNKYDPNRIFSNTFLDTLLPYGATLRFAVRRQLAHRTASEPAAGVVPRALAGSDIKGSPRATGIRPIMRLAGITESLSARTT